MPARVSVFVVSLARERLCASPLRLSLSTRTRSLRSIALSTSPLVRPLAYTRPPSRSASLGNLSVPAAGQSIRPLATAPVRKAATTAFKTGSAESTENQLHLPPGYTYYINHQDGPQPASLMPHVIESPTPAPHLPRCSVFNYLFPPSPSDGAKSFNTGYTAPDPNAPAFIDAATGRTVTRHEVGEQGRRLAGGLRKLGLKKGDVGCIYGLNSLEWVNALMGCQALRVIVSPANYGYTPPELLHQLTNSTAKVVFVQPELLPTLEKALKLPKAPKMPDSHIILLCHKSAKPATLSRFKAIDEVWAEAIDVPLLKPGEEKETSYLCYSSGTTGLAKGVETSHHNITSQVQALNLVYEPLIPGKDVVLGLLPFGHIYGLTVILHQTLSVGLPVVILPRFDEIAFLTAIQRYKVTWTLVVPPVLIVLLNSPNVAKYDLSSLKGMMCGAAPLGADLAKRFQEQFKPVLLTQGYGLTETSPVTHVMTSRESQSHFGQVGKLMPTFQARIVDNETGKDVEQGERGEIWFRGPSVMKGYWRNEEATRNTFADGGWFKTGDVAIVDKDGYFSIVDRVKELIKYKGFQVPPAELEALLLTHPKVADAAVIGIWSNAQATELPRAYIVPKGGLAALPADQHAAFGTEIASWVKAKVAQHKRLRGGVLLMEAIPKSPSGKILRKDLRAMAKKEEEDPVKAGRQAKL